MATTLLTSTIVKDSPVMSLISIPNNSGMLIVNIDESSFTDEMYRELLGIRFEFYTDVNGEKIIICNKNKLWHTNSHDRSIVLYDMPSSCYIKIIGIVDDRYEKTTGRTLETTYPISVYLDNSRIR